MPAAVEVLPLPSAIQFPKATQERAPIVVSVQECSLLMVRAQSPMLLVVARHLRDQLDHLQRGLAWSEDVGAQNLWTRRDCGDLQQEGAGSRGFIFVQKQLERFGCARG